MMSAMDAVRTIELPRINSPTGSITPVAGGDQVPFEIRRIYFLYDIVSGAHRGGHAHWELEQVYVAVMGAFRVVLDDGRCKFAQPSSIVRVTERGFELVRAGVFSEANLKIMHLDAQLSGQLEEANLQRAKQSQSPSPPARPSASRRRKETPQRRKRTAD